MNNILKFKCRFQLVVKNIDVRYHGEKWGNINYHTFFEKARKLCWYQCINTTENEYWNALKYSESIYWNIYISHDNSDIPDAIFKVQTYFHFLLIVRLFSQFIVTSFQIKKKNKQTSILVSYGPRWQIHIFCFFSYQLSKTQEYSVYSEGKSMSKLQQGNPWDFCLK